MTKVISAKMLEQLDCSIKTNTKTGHLGQLPKGKHMHMSKPSIIILKVIYYKDTGRQELGTSARELLVWGRVSGLAEIL